ncbi:conserved hypothetical protein [Histoplasma capsulatum var. duboisii H88]|uniref:Uncharacterized protein n=1 Tax=Ajellomyces capsulatus (strain H88) TaxID=544711 RepID=F0UTE1_AJEC8|nr:conserved hypothetical protein [Histoplasma capsulatum var. duboisii H88]
MGSIAVDWEVGILRLIKTGLSALSRRQEGFPEISFNLLTAVTQQSINYDFSCATTNLGSSVRDWQEASSHMAFVLSACQDYYVKCRFSCEPAHDRNKPRDLGPRNTVKPGWLKASLDSFTYCLEHVKGC